MSKRKTIEIEINDLQNSKKVLEAESYRLNRELKDLYEVEKVRGPQRLESERIKRRLKDISDEIEITDGRIESRKKELKEHKDLDKKLSNLVLLVYLALL